MGRSFSDLRIFTCNSHKPLAEEIAQILGEKIGDSKVERFSDGEINIHTADSVRGKDVFIIQSTSNPVNENLMELLIMLDAFRRASAGRITCVIPYFGYARQDRKARARDPITAKLVADLLTTAGADRVLTMDLHAAQIQGFFSIPVDHLVGIPLLYQYYKNKIPKEERRDWVAVSPDLGSVTRTRKFAGKMDLPLAIIDKRRPKANVSEVMNIIGEIRDKKVIILDDMIDTAGTITNAAVAIMENGAKEVHLAATHGVLSGNATEKLEKAPIEELVLLNTINIPKEKHFDKMKVLSVAPVFADAIGRIHHAKSVSELFL